MSDRKLARIVQIDSLHEIAGAERIELAFIGGWQVVVGKGLYKVGEKCMYFEVDSLLPTAHPAFAELANRLSSKLLFEIDGKGYARIKTAKLMKQLSQGFCVPLSELNIFDLGGVEVDQDFTKFLGVLKYEKGEERSMNNAGVADGVKGRVTKPFPSFIPKTDQNRVQNIVPRYLQSVESGELFEKTFKLDGSSMTIWIKNGVTGVASRNVSFRLQTENKGFVQSFRDYFKQVKKHGFRHAKFVTQLEADVNAFTQMANNSGVLTALVHEGRNLAIQGEMVGPSIQKNFEGVKSNQFYIYDIYDIDKQKYLLPSERLEFIADYELTGVPPAGIVSLLPTVAEAIEDADGPSGLNGKYREGVVYKSMERDFSFKVISNKYLLKEE
jgi:RNA ligase (TIGR02306 family)